MSAARASLTLCCSCPASKSCSRKCEVRPGSLKNLSYISCRTCNARASHCRSNSSTHVLPRTALSTSSWLDGSDAGHRRCATAVFSLVGGFAEVYTYIRQRRSNAEGIGEIVTFEIVTGILGEESSLIPHGHTIRVSVTGAL